MAYRMTPARRAALRKAQQASARKRRGHGKVRTHLKKHKKKYIAGAVIGGALLAHRKSPTVRRARRKVTGAPKRARVQHKRFKAGGGSYKSLVKKSNANNPKKGGARVMPNGQFTMGAPYKGMSKRKVRKTVRKSARRR